MNAPPVFIVGNDRSGTTMLRLILDGSAELAIPPESMFLTDIGLNAPQPPQALVDALWEHPKVRLWELPGPPPRVPDGLDPAAARRFALSAPFAAYAAAQNKPRWGDKTPHYVHHVDQLLATWPEARIVILVRDGRDVARSLLAMPFGPNNAWAAAQWWARGIRAGRRAEADHPGSVISVRYEDVVADPAAEVTRLCAFAGIEFTPAMLALENADRHKVVADQAGWFPTLFDGINDRGVGRWRSEMTAREEGVFAALAGPELAALGYPVPTRPVPPPTARAAALYHRHNELMRNVNFIRLRVFQERGRELGVALRRRLADRSR